jgi:three-Cys-motif partner protein
VEGVSLHPTLIDLDGDKVASLRDLVGQRSDVEVLHGNCNEVLLRQVFPQVAYEDYRRGLCLLDPYGMHLDWEVIHRAAEMRSLEIFINFPIMDMNRNVLRLHPGDEDPSHIGRMTAFWGDESWRRAAYRKVATLFGSEDEKLTNEAVVAAFCDRLRKVAGFAHVAAPLPMKNSTGAVVYYLLFASHKPVAKSIVDDIYRSTGEEGPWAGQRSSGRTRRGTR